MTKLELGKEGENAACQYLERREYEIVKRNFKCKSGEIDIIAIDKNELVFIEVKTRCSKQYGEAREAVTEIKKKHIKKATEFYIHTNQLESCYLLLWQYSVYFPLLKGCWCFFFFFFF